MEISVSFWGLKTEHMFTDLHVYKTIKETCMFALTICFLQTKPLTSWDYDEFRPISRGLHMLPLDQIINTHILSFHLWQRRYIHPLMQQILLYRVTWGRHVTLYMAFPHLKWFRVEFNYLSSSFFICLPPIHPQYTARIKHTCHVKAQLKCCSLNLNCSSLLSAANLGHLKFLNNARSWFAAKEKKKIHNHFQTKWTVFHALVVSAHASSCRASSKCAVMEVESTLFWHNYRPILFHLLQ